MMEAEQVIVGWRRWRRGMLAVVVAVGCLPGVAAAESEVDILLNKLVEKGVLTSLEAGSIRREISDTKDARNKQIAKDVVPEPARNWRWKGDIRLRNEFRNREQANTTLPNQDTSRQRIRFRYGAEGKVADDLKVNFRIATGSSTDPVSTNQSFDVNFNKVTINLDLANVEYAPTVAGISQVKLIGGIMENPLWMVGPMVFDGDLSVDGVAAKLAHDIGPVTLFTNDGIFVLDTDEGEASTLWMAQGGAAVKLLPDAESTVLKNLKLTGAVSYQDYKNTYAVASTSALNKAGTDPLVRENQNTGRVRDFNQINPTVELASMVGEVPVSVFGDWVRNLAANGDLDDGFQVGFKVGKATVPWSLTKGWEGGYFYQRLAADAAYDEFTDSDFLDGGTNNRGHVVWVTLATLKNSTLGAKLFITQQLENRAVSGTPTGAQGKDHEDRFQLDWVTKF